MKFRRSARAALFTAIVALTASVGLSGAIAQSTDDLRAEREAVRREAAAAAGELDALSAEDAELVAALEDLANHIASEESRIAAVEASIAEAEAEIEAAEIRSAEIDEEVAAIRQRLQTQALNAFVSPRYDALEHLDSDDLVESALRSEFLDELVGDEMDLVDELRSRTAEQEAIEAAAVAAQARAEADRVELEARLEELAVSQAEAEELRLQVQARIDEWERVSLEIANAEIALTAEIAALEEEARRLAAEEAARQAELAAQEAEDNADADEDAGSGTDDAGNDGDTGGDGSTPAGDGSFTVTHRPVPGIVTSPFGNRVHPIFGTVRTHSGLDMNGSTGDPIIAAASGTVISADYRSGYGNTVMIDHGGGYITLYAHMSSLGVSKNDTVSGGDYIGAVGSTGWSTGPHLHWEVRLDGVALDPAGFI